jgi:hypothetical protein
VLSDPNRSDEFKNSEHWKTPLINNMQIGVPHQTPDGRQVYRSNSFSGNERNRLVMRIGNGFVDRSLVSGIDCREDGRSFAILDFDGDGWLDIALASVNKPRLRLFRNRFGEFGEGGRVVDVMLRGSHTGAVSDTARSSRDAIGALLTVVTSEHTRVFRKSIGEGLAAQNSGRIRIAIAKGDTLQKISVRWPSGKITELIPTADQSLIEIAE